MANTGRKRTTKPDPAVAVTEGLPATEVDGQQELPVTPPVFVDDEHRHVFAILTALKANRRWCDSGYADLLRHLGLPRPGQDEAARSHTGTVTVHVPITASITLVGSWPTREAAQGELRTMMEGNRREAGNRYGGRHGYGRYAVDGSAGAPYTFDLDAAVFEGLPEGPADKPRTPHADALADTADLVAAITDGMRAAYRGDRYRGRYANWPVAEYQDGTPVPTVSPYVAKVVRRAVRAQNDGDITFGEMRTVVRLLGLPTPPHRDRLDRSYVMTMGEGDRTIRFHESAWARGQAVKTVTNRLHANIVVEGDRRLLAVAYGGRMDVTDVVPATVAETMAALTVEESEVPEAARGWFALMDQVYADGRSVYESDEDEPENDEDDTEGDDPF